MTAAIWTMLFIKNIRNSQCLPKDLVLCNGTFDSTNVIFYYLFGGGIVKIFVT
jgi:hypothetical protein